MHFMPSKSRTEGTTVGIDENTADNDFSLAVWSGIIIIPDETASEKSLSAWRQIICLHLQDLVTACKNTEVINDRIGLQFVNSLLT